MKIYGYVKNIENKTSTIETNNALYGKKNIKINFDIFSPIIRLSLIDNKEIKVMVRLNLKYGLNIVEECQIIKEEKR